MDTSQEWRKFARKYPEDPNAPVSVYKCNNCLDNGYTWDGQLCGCTFCYLCVQMHENCKCEKGSPKTGDIQFVVAK